MSGDQDQNDGEEKQHDPTPQRLEQARRDGNIPRSTDLSAAAGLLGLTLAILLLARVGLDRSILSLASLIEHSDRLAQAAAGPGGRGLLLTGLWPMVPLLALLMLLPFALALAALLAQRAIVFTPKNLMPKASRISILQTAKSKFGPTGLMEFAKSVTKLIAVTTVLTLVILKAEDDILTSAKLPALGALTLTGSLMETLLISVTLIFATIAVIDFFWQRFDHMRKLRMTHKELRDEAKESEGDPHLRAQRRQKGMDIATNRMMADVPKADVVIVNPTHYAVALIWSREAGSAPVCSAKGVDEVARMIRETAATAGVPIYSDPPSARAIHAMTPIGQEIDPDMYRAVAAAIQFAQKMRKTSQERSWEQ